MKENGPPAAAEGDGGRQRRDRRRQQQQHSSPAAALRRRGRRVGPAAALDHAAVPGRREAPRRGHGDHVYRARVPRDVSLFGAVFFSFWKRMTLLTWWPRKRMYMKRISEVRGLDDIRPGVSRYS